VSFCSAVLAEQLKTLEQTAGAAERWVVAFSGGLDSMVLLHALSLLAANSERPNGIPLTAIHINHQLHSNAAAWSAQCASLAKALGVECRSIDVSIDPKAANGLEAAAREARYAALRTQIRSGDWLFSAHHRDDQAETLLLNLVRGSGPAGIAGIGAALALGDAWLVRPLLNIDQSALQDYASAHALQWIDDPSNTDRRFDRNFLRHEIVPVLRSRWPDIATRLQRSAGHAGEAAQLLSELGRIDLDALGADSRRVPIDGLVTLSSARQRNLIRCALRDRGLSMPSAVVLNRVLSEVIPAREDAQPLVEWPGGAVRRYRDHLYLLTDKLAPRIEESAFSADAAILGPGLGRLALERNAELGLSDAAIERGLRVCPRLGGERFTPMGQRHTKKLKKLLQDEGVVPWMRDRLPLIYAGNDLVAVGDLWLSNSAASRPGVAVRWSGRPALH